MSKEFKAQASASKVMLLFDHEGPLLLEFKEPGMSINAQWYGGTLECLCTAIKKKYSGNMTHGIILLHDNTHPHVVDAIKTKVQHMRCEVLEHLAYSLDLSPATSSSWATEAGTQGTPIPVRH
jgi:hypothetical protein